ncbi:Uncharacterised protein g701 [Pycnogonum litorale]
MVFASTIQTNSCVENEGHGTDGTDGKNRSESTGQTSAILAPSTETYSTGNTATESEDVTTTSADDKNVRNLTSAAIETTTEKTKRKRRSTTKTTVGTTTEKSRRTATSKSPPQRPTTSRTRATPPPTGLTIGNTFGRDVEFQFQ